ncbi:MAG: hypothetical protein AAGJ85_03085, partial [Pseudomonadota bacterium]
MALSDLQDRFMKIEPGIRLGVEIALVLGLGLVLARMVWLAVSPQASVAAYPDFIRTHFGLKNDRLILCAISLGYEDADHPANSFRTERAGLED